MIIASYGYVDNINQTPKLQINYLGHFDPKERKKMNENDIIEMVGDADTVATLAAANNGLPVNPPFDVGGEGEDAQPEATGFIGEDTSDIVAV